MCRRCLAIVADENDLWVEQVHDGKPYSDVMCPVCELDLREHDQRTGYDLEFVDLSEHARKLATIASSVKPPMHALYQALGQAQLFVHFLHMA
jgi:hypothetical protein